MVPPVLFVILSIIELGVAKEPEFKNPNARSVAVAKTPFAKL